VTNRSTYESSVAGSNTTLINSNQANALTAQESINAVGVNIGAHPSFGLTAGHDATVRAANVTYQVAKQMAAATQRFNRRATPWQTRAT
jgi:hypothetical protein